MDFYIILEHNYDNILDKTCHIIDIDRSIQGGWYRQITLICGFDTRVKKRFYYHRYTKRSDSIMYCKYSLTREEEIEQDLDLEQTMFEKYGITGKKSYNLVFHSSVYEFFNSIDYDYKNNKVSHLDTLLLLTTDS